MDKLFIPVILGTNREGRESEKVARLVVGEIEKRSDMETLLFDVQDFAFPAAGYGEAIKDRFPEYRDAVIRADGLVIVTPEYNRGIPGPLKSVLDLLFKEYKYKAAGLAGVSNGPWGGTRVVVSLLPILRELGLVVTKPDLYFTNVHEAFNPDGTPKDEGVYDRTKKFLDSLVFMAAALKAARVS